VLTYCDFIISYSKLSINIFEIEVVLGPALPFSLAMRDVLLSYLPRDCRSFSFSMSVSTIFERSESGMPEEPSISIALSFQYSLTIVSLITKRK
jgi:hypothetical protein